MWCLPVVLGALSASFCLTAPLARAVELVSDATIKVQKDLTSEHKLKNGIQLR